MNLYWAYSAGELCKVSRAERKGLQLAEWTKPLAERWRVARFEGIGALSVCFLC
jgi:hypothetical protein